MADALARLSALLEAEREALLSGDFDRIAQMLPEKTALAETLWQENADPAGIAPLRTRLLRNQELFDRALEGIRAVGRRLAALQDARVNLRTYDRSGAERHITSRGAKRLERRA